MGQTNDSHFEKMVLFAPQLPPDSIRITDNTFKPTIGCKKK